MKIRVELIDDHGITIREGCCTVSEHLLREPLQVMDFPSKSADPIGKMFCTPQKILNYTESMRKQIAQVLTDEFMHLFRLKDTKMGYCKND